MIYERSQRMSSVMETFSLRPDRSLAQSFFMKETTTYESDGKELKTHITC